MSASQEEPVMAQTAPRRTYGRARQVEQSESLVVANDAPPLQPSHPISPAKALLDRWSCANTAWRDSTVFKADMATLPQEDNVDEDDVKAMYAALKKGETKAETAPAALPARVARPLVASTSSLSSLPTSTPPKLSDALPQASSPPQGSPSLSSASSSMPLDETEPVGGRRPRVQRLVESEDEDDLVSTKDLISEEAEKKVSDAEAPPPPADDFGLFDDEEQSFAPSTRGIKPLNKKDQEQLQRDLAKAQRERPAEMLRAENRQRPVSQWLTNASNASAATKITQLSPPPPASDEIQQFTPSSVPVKGVPTSTGPDGRVVPATSSPTPQQDASMRLAAVDDDEDDDLSFADTMSKAVQKDERARKLKLAKEMAIRAAKAKAAKQEDSDDDLLIVPPEPQPRLPTSKAPPPARKANDARGVLNRANAVPATTRNRQNVLRFAGKLGVVQQPVTETHLHLAATEFGHAELKQANAGSRPAGQKHGRDAPISSAQLEQDILRRHQLQARKLAKRKEEQYGYDKKFPPKRIPDLDAILKSSAASNAAPVADSDDDEEDSDYAPEDEAHSGEENGENENEATPISDEVTTANPSAVDGTSEGGIPDSDNDKENRPEPSSVNLEDDHEEEDEENIPRTRKARPSRRVAFQSDDEDEPVHDPSLRLATESKAAPAAPAFAGFNNPAPGFGAAFNNAAPGFGAGFNNAAHAFGAGFGGAFGAAPAAEEPAFDLAGFGSGSGGFSQLFDMTQAPEGGLGVTDGFAALRQQELVMLPAHALLPDNIISESQKRRDNAVVMAVIESEREPPPEPAPPAKQYLNAEGFFTQTHPADFGTQIPSDTADVAPSNTMVATSVSAALPSSTLVNSSDIPSSPTQGLRRLKPRRSPSPTQAERVEPTATNAFDALRAGARAATEVKRPKTRLIDEQAEESDDDSGWGGWGIDKKDDDEDEDVDDTGYVPELVNDEQLSEEEKRKVAELNAAKRREIEEADDARREAEAKKITEGHYRTKRRGNDFLSDEEDDDAKPRRLTKKQRRQRKLDGVDGLFKLEGEENSFLQGYEDNLASDNEFEEAPLSPGPEHSPMRDSRTAKERLEMLRLRAREKTTVAVETDIMEVENTSAFSISRRSRTAVSMEETDEFETVRKPSRQLTAARSVESYSKFISDESQNPRRMGGAAGVSVVVNRSESSISIGGGSRRGTGSSKDSSRSVNRTGSLGGVLMGKQDRFL